MIYDIFYVSKGKINALDWLKFKNKFPTSQKIENVSDFSEVKSKALTKFFYLVWDGTEIINFNFDYRISKWDEEYIHVWKTLRNKEETYQGGIALFPKNINLVSSREFANKFYLKKKEINQIASKQIYPRYSISNYLEYKNLIENTEHDMIWYTPTDIDIINDNIFDIYFDPNNGMYDYDRNENHVFKNSNFYDGVMLFSKNKIISKKEFNFRFLTTKKEWEQIVSMPKPYDIFFISYNEENADDNYRLLLKRFPRAKRIHGIKGIHNAHKKAAEQSTTDMFWVVDADAVVLDDFNFEFTYIPHYDSGNRKEQLSTVHIWKSKNPINDLTYGYGGIKLLPTSLVLDMNMDSVDMTTSISEKIKIMPDVSNITSFNINPYETWKSAFRECVKLSSKIIDRNYDEENEVRLKIWMEKGEDKPFGKYAMAGAKAGYMYGSMNLGNNEALNLINNFDWLKSQFIEWQKENEQSAKNNYS